MAISSLEVFNTGCKVTKNINKLGYIMLGSISKVVYPKCYKKYA
jgi:hypothetical protein